jgi:hypothetical protein
MTAGPRAGGRVYGAGFAGGMANAKGGMTEDVDSTLANLEQRLRALQAELDAEAAVQPAPRPEQPAPRPPPPPERPLERVLARPPAAADEDPLDRFGEELRRLVALWEQTLVEVRGESILFSGDVVIEARADLPALGELDRALRALPGVASVTLRAYAAGTAELDVHLDRDVALIAALRETLSFTVEAARPGRLEVALLG